MWSICHVIRIICALIFDFADEQERVKIKISNRNSKKENLFIHNCLNCLHTDKVKYESKKGVCETS